MIPVKRLNIEAIFSLTLSPALSFRSDADLLQNAHWMNMLDEQPVRPYIGKTVQIELPIVVRARAVWVCVYAGL